MVCVAVGQVGGWTALHRAADNGHVDAVKALLAAGANVTATDVRCGDSRFLVAKGFQKADVVPSWCCIFLTPYQAAGRTALAIAMQNGHETIVSLLSK